MDAARRGAELLILAPGKGVQGQRPVPLTHCHSEERSDEESRFFSGPAKPRSLALLGMTKYGRLSGATWSFARLDSRGRLSPRMHRYWIFRLVRAFNSSTICSNLPRRWA